MSKKLSVHILSTLSILVDMRDFYLNKLLFYNFLIKNPLCLTLWNIYKIKYIIIINEKYTIHI